MAHHPPSYGSLRERRTEERRGNKERIYEEEERKGKEKEKEE